jgi:hypothetical protein
MFVYPVFLLGSAESDKKEVGMSGPDASLDVILL